MAFIVRLARTLETGIRSIERVASNIGVFLLVLLMFLAVSDVIGRYVFNSPIFGAMEFEKILMGSVAFLGWAYVHSRGAHISVDLIFRHYPPRAQAIIGFITMLFSLAVFSLITWRVTVITMTEWRIDKLINVVLIPVAPFKLLLIFGVFLLCLECIIQMVHLVPKMIRKKE